MPKDSLYDHIEKVGKSREEQELEFREYIAPFAKPGCQICLGKGYSGWHVLLEQLLPCRCVEQNLEKTKTEQLIGDSRKDESGIISWLRNTFKMN